MSALAMEVRGKKTQRKCNKGLSVQMSFEFQASHLHAVQKPHSC